ncbi:MAG: lectin-like domain-containing protein [Bryobacteraceae bacterium]
MAIAVLTQHNDNIRSGANLLESKLSPSNVDLNKFGLLCSRRVDGQIYAQPLYVPAVPVGGVTRNIVLVATMNNWVYAFDADDTTTAGTFLWRHQVDPHPVPAHVYGGGYTDIRDNIGILSTPVVDPSTRTAYLVAAAFDPAVLGGPIGQAQSAFKQLLFSLDISTGQLRPASSGSSNPVEINGSVPGRGYHDAQESAKPVDKTGGNAKVTVTVRALDVNGTPNIPRDVVVKDSTGGVVRFSPMQQLQRPALLLSNGLLYIAFGSHGDFDPYHGWVFAYEAATLKQHGVFCSTPNGAQAGIWQAGEGLVADGAGNVYCGTGNGDTKNAGTPSPDLGESFVRLRASPGGLRLDAFLTAFQDATDPVPDEDLGAASPTLLPDGFLVGGGKDGNLYLIDPSKMTNAGSDGALMQRFLASRGPGSRETITHHIHGSPVVYDSPNHGPLVYVWGENDVLRTYRYDPVTHSFPGQPNQRNAEGVPAARGDLFASNDVKERLGMPGAMLSLSADGKKPGTAILWASLPPFDNANHMTVDGLLAAYDATQFDSQGRLVLLWHSHQNPVDDPGKFAKFCCPTIADGKVFLATFSNALRVYGPRAVPDGGYNFAFGGKTGLTLNGSARSNGGAIRLTGKHLFQAGSFFASNAVAVTKFNTKFRFHVLGNNVADGLTFCIQGEGRHALGGPGGGLGYGPDAIDPLSPGFKVTKSVALKFGLFDSLTNGPRSTMGLYQNGASPTGPNAIGGEVALDTMGIDLHSGHEFKVTLAYDGSTLTATIRDTLTQKQVVHPFPFDIPAVTGAQAFVGFTGGTGGLSADQDILSWEFSSL